MIRYRGCLVFGIIGSLAVVLSGCVGGGVARDNAELLEDAREAAKLALGELLPGWPGTVEDVGVRNNVPVVQTHAPADTEGPYAGAYGYGAWLGERGFAVYTAPAAGIPVNTHMWPTDDSESEGAPGEAAGFTATWQGVMLGMDSAAEGDAGVQGNASMELDSGMGTVDIDFSDVAGINNDNEYDGHSWSGVSVTDSSFSGMSSEGGLIDGQFYGAHHEDVMGGFMYDTLTGAWGASRMEAGAGAAGDDMDGDGGMGGGDMDDGHGMAATAMDGDDMGDNGMTVHER